MIYYLIGLPTYLYTTTPVFNCAYIPILYKSSRVSYRAHLCWVNPYTYKFSPRDADKPSFGLSKYLLPALPTQKLLNRGSPLFFSEGNDVQYYFSNTITNRAIRCHEGTLLIIQEKYL